MDTQTTETRDALVDRVVKLAARQVEMPPEQVSLDSSFQQDLGYDSLDVVEFVMEVEDEFDGSVPDDAADKIATVRQAIDEMRRLVESQDDTEVKN